MTKRTFIILTILYAIFFSFMTVSLFQEGLITLGLAIACLAVLSWGFVKIKYEYEGFKPPKKNKGPQTF